jgi:hypothetical protein
MAELVICIGKSGNEVLNGPEIVGCTGYSVLCNPDTGCPERGKLQQGTKKEPQHSTAR